MNRTPLYSTVAGYGLFVLAGLAPVSAQEGASSPVVDQVVADIDQDSEQTLAIVETAVSQNNDLAVDIVVAAVNATQSTGNMIVSIVEAATLALPVELRPPFIDSIVAVYPDIENDVIGLATPGRVEANSMSISSNPPVTEPGGQIFIAENPGPLGSNASIVTEDDADEDGTPGGGGGGNTGDDGDDTPPRQPPITQ